MTTALSTIKTGKDKKALICLNEGDFGLRQPLFQPQVTEIALELPGGNETESADCWNIQGKIVPKRHTIDRMGEAAGIFFIAEQSKNHVELRDDPIGGRRQVFVSESQGKIRLPDGSWKTSSLQSYEFDPVLRALEDQKLFSITDQPLSYQPDKPGKGGSTYKGKATGQLILENNKRGRQMAETGARLRVIKELTAMPTALTREQASRPLLFGRWVQNTDYLLKTPEGRLLAAAQATGTQELVAALYGKQALPGLAEGQPGETRNVTEPENPGSGQDPAGADLAGEAAGDDPAPRGEQSEFDRLTVALEEFMDGYGEQLDRVFPTGNPYQIIQAELKDLGATVESRRDLVDRTRALLTRMGVAV
ncbi:MAG: hypothetical protein LBK02_07580 [Treponema sp.]|jgi:hypothetical protein|nr:hypothetical protein [Treponema sp.]